MARIDIGTVALNYEMAGSGETLVLLHEIGGTLKSWSAVAELLKDRFRVLSYDQRGAGQSDRIAGPFALETQIDDLERLLAALKLTGPVHLCGGAIGSALAVRFTTRNPQRVKSLVLACPALNVSRDRKQYLADRAAKVEREGMTATVDGTLANSYPAEVQRDRAAYEAYRTLFLANDPKSYAAINRAFAEFDATPGLATLRCPVLVLAGTHDKLRPPDTARAVASRIAGAKFEEIDSGHVMPVQAPAAMAAAMREFYEATSVAAKTP